jgi:hypothetical protein
MEAHWHEDFVLDHPDAAAERGNASAQARGPSGHEGTTAPRRAPMVGLEAGPAAYAEANHRSWLGQTLKAALQPEQIERSRLADSRDR